MKTNIFYSTDVEEEVDIDILLKEIDVKKLIIHNDDVNTFDWVIDSLISICRHSPEQAEQCTYIIHYRGKCQVKNGSEEEIARMCNAFLQIGIIATID